MYEKYGRYCRGGPMAAKFDATFDALVAGLQKNEIKTLNDYERDWHDVTWRTPQQFASFCGALAQNTSLKTLDFPPFAEFASGSLTGAFPRIPAEKGVVSKIDLAGAKALGAALETNKTLQGLHLFWIDLNEDCIQTILNSVAKNKTLRNLSLNSMGWGKNSVEALKLALKTGNLESLRIAHCVDPAVATVVIEALQDPNCTLTEIQFTNNAFDAKTLLSLTQAAIANKKVKHLDLSAHGKKTLGPKEGAEIGTLLKSATKGVSLKLGLRNQKIGDEGAKSIAEAMDANPGILTGLDLSHNDIKEEGAEALVKAFAKSKTLAELDLYGTKMSEKLLRELIEVTMIQNKAMHTLRLNGEELKEIETMQVLARALKENKVMRDLSLYGNKIDHKMAHELVEGLKENYSLKRLDLDFNDIGSEGTSEIAGWLENNSTLVELRLGNNGIRKAGLEDLQEAMQENATVVELNLAGLYYDKSDEGGDYSDSDDSDSDQEDDSEYNINLAMKRAAVEKERKECTEIRNAIQAKVEKNRSLLPESMVVAKDTVTRVLMEGPRQEGFVPPSRIPLRALDIVGQYLGLTSLAREDEQESKLENGSEPLGEKQAGAKQADAEKTSVKQAGAQKEGMYFGFEEEKKKGEVKEIKANEKTQKSPESPKGKTSK